MKLQLNPDEEYILKLAAERDVKPSSRLMGSGDCISELWDIPVCQIYSDSLRELAFMNFLTISWVTDGMGKLRNYRINNAGRHALWLNEREKERQNVEAL